MEFLDEFSSKPSMSNFADISLLGAAVIYADEFKNRRTDMKIIGGFCDYANAPKMADFRIMHSFFVFFLLLENNPS